MLEAMGTSPIQSQYLMLQGKDIRWQGWFRGTANDADLILVETAAEINWRDGARVGQRLRQEQAVAFCDEIFADLEQREKLN